MSNLALLTSSDSLFEVVSCPEPSNTHTVSITLTRLSTYHFSFFLFQDITGTYFTITDHPTPMNPVLSVVWTHHSHGFHDRQYCLDLRLQAFCRRYHDFCSQY